MTKHTPGPWEVRKDGEFMQVLAVNDPEEIAAMPDWMDDFKAEEEANAHLIAAAPELLEACKKAATCFSLPDEVKSIVRAAIAKAEGGAA